MADKLPLTVLTGFLGSGKTTLLKRFLATQEAEGTGVIVNEFGEVGVDHHLFAHATESVELLAKGRARRADISRALHDLVRQSKFGGRGRIRRAIVETSGLADPAPIVAVLAEDPWLRAHVELASIVAAIDGVNGPDTLQRRAEARRQAALCDTVVITKGDMRAASAFTSVRACVRRLSPDALVLDAHDPAFDLKSVFGPRASARRLQNPATLDAIEDGGDEIRSFVLHPAEPVDWPVFTLWLSALLHAHGQRILRVKGLVRTSAAAGALAIHGVQNIMHPPAHLTSGEAANEPSFLVFIASGLSPEDVERSYGLFKQQCIGSTHESAASLRRSAAAH